MKKTAKIISLAITLVMILSIVVTLAINASAASAPKFELVAEKIDNKTLNITVNLVSGGFKALDGQLSDSSDDVVCKSIKLGNAWKEFRDAEDEAERPASYAVNSETGKVAFAHVSNFENKGTVFVATYTVDFNKEFSITFDTTSCRVSDNGNESDVTNEVANATYKFKPSGSDPTESKPTESKPTESKPTESKPTESKPTESKPTESKPTTPTKPSTKTVIVTQIVTLTQPDGQTVTGADGKPATTVITEASVVNVDEAIVDESADGESPEYADTFGYDFSTTTTLKADGSKLISNSHINPKIVIPVAIGAAVIIAGIVTAVILVKKRGENEAESAALVDDFTDSFEPYENDAADTENFTDDSDYDVTDIDE